MITKSSNIAKSKKTKKIKKKRNTAKLIQYLSKDGKLELDLEDEITGAITVVHQGNIIWDPTRQVTETQQPFQPERQENVTEEAAAAKRAKTTKNKMTEVDNVPQGVYEVPQEARALKSELSTLNSELIELTNQMTEQIAMIVQVDSTLKQHLETQKQEVTEASRNLQDDRLNLERNNEKQMNIINGLYNDSELKETSVNYEYMAWILGSLTIVGISMYQIKRFS